jgi:pimeloyl-ACP methyl ester carboxylesterase
MADGFKDFFYKAADGLRLHARVYGKPIGGRLPVVCLPGLTRNVRDFHELALVLSVGKNARQVVSFDYRGRGQSAYDPNHKNYNVGIEAGDILAGLAQLGIERALFIGTSRGGLILHVLAAIRPQILAGVVLNDIGPVVEAAGLQNIKDYLSKAPRPNSLAEAVAAQKAAHDAAFSALSDADWERMAAAIYKQDGAKLVPDFDPMLLADLMTLDLSQPIPDLWPQFAAFKDVPMLAIRGANSLLLSADTLTEMGNRHANFATITVAGQGHAPFLETGDLPTQIAAFFDRVDPAAA